MKIVKILLAAVFAVTSLSASAQEKDEYIFVKHPYLQFQGGGQYTLGEDTKFKNLISPNAQFAFGYQFTPVVGARIQANGWQSKGGAIDMKNESQSFKWNYVAPGIDAMFNLSHLIGGFNPKRVVNISAFLGAGANIAWGNEEAAALQNPKNVMSHLWSGTQVLFVGRGGIAIDFRLCDAVSLGLEGNANILNDHYNSKHTNNPDWYFNALLGLRINLAKTFKVKEKPVVIAPEPEPEPVKIACPGCNDAYGNGNCPESEYGKCKNNSNCSHALTCKCKKDKPAPVVVEKKIDVFFLIRSSVISAEENVKVQDMIAFLKANPSAKVKVTGYADAGTGNPRVNMGYSQNRADIVEKALLDAGIAPERITKEALGDTVQPFAENDLNRVTIAIAN